MTSPDMFGVSQMPDGAVTTNTVNKLQSVTKESIAQAAVSDLIANLNELEASFFNGLLGGFASIPAMIANAINQFISDLVYALKNVTGGFIDLTGFLHETSATATTASSVANSANTTANSAYTLAGTANTAASAAVTQASAAANQAATAQSTAASASSRASYWETEFVAASAAVVLGINEVRIGLCQNVPVGLARTLTDMHVALESQPAGMTFELHKWDSTGVTNTLLGTYTLAANVTRANWANLGFSMSSRERVFINVTSIIGSTPPVDLQILFFGVMQ
jgi:hypothetical protein